MTRSLDWLFEHEMRSNTPGSIIIRVDKQTALRLLHYMEENRRIRTEKTTRFARLILQNKFYLIGQSISYDRNGRGLDGRHRLIGIVLADPEEPIPMLLFYGGDPESWVAYDSGTRRTLTDVVSKDHWLQDIGQPIVRAMVKGAYRDKEHTDPAMVELLNKAELHQAGLAFVRSLLPRYRVKTSRIAHRPYLQGALVRAFYHCPSFSERDLLEEFCLSIRYRDVKGETCPCKVEALDILRGFETRHDTKHGGNDENEELYRLTQRAWLIYRGDISPCSPISGREQFPFWYENPQTGRFSVTVMSDSLGCQAA